MQEAWELLNITKLRLWTALLQVINNSPRHAVISSRAITGKYSTDVSVSCLLSPGVEIVEISVQDNIETLLRYSQYITKVRYSDLPCNKNPTNYLFWFR